MVGNQKPWWGRNAASPTSEGQTAGGLSPLGLVATVVSDQANAEGRRWKHTHDPSPRVTPHLAEPQMQFRTWR